MGDLEGMSGQDGRAVITMAAFGCIHYSANTEISGGGARSDAKGDSE